MSVRIAQVSDAHLSKARPFFEENFARVAEAVRATRPDLTLATGDLTLSGADADDEMRHGVDRHAAIGAELLCIPGNHDIGNEVQSARNVVTVDRVDRWRRIAGPSAWVRDLPGWRLLGYDCQSLASSDEQWETIERGLRDAGSRSVALVQHKPLCVQDLAETGSSYWSLVPDVRTRLLSLFGARRPALVVSGHLHQWRMRRTDGIAQVWGPSTAFILGDPYQPAFGSKLVGWVEHLFHADGTHEARLQTVDAMRLDDIGQMPQVYRQLPRLDEQPDLWKHTK